MSSSFFPLRKTAGFSRNTAGHATALLLFASCRNKSHRFPYAWLQYSFHYLPSPGMSPHKNATSLQIWPLNAPLPQGYSTEEATAVTRPNTSPDFDKSGKAEAADANNHVCLQWQIPAVSAQPHIEDGWL